MQSRYECYVVMSPAVFLDGVLGIECNFAWWLVLLYVLLHVFVSHTHILETGNFQCVYRNCELCVIGMLFKKRQYG